MFINDIKSDLAKLRIPRWAASAVPLYRAWMTLAFVLGWFVFRALLILVYGILILPIGLIFRIIGKDPLSRRIDRSARTYWIRVEPRKKTYTKKF